MDKPQEAVSKEGSTQFSLASTARKELGWRGSWSDHLSAEAVYAPANPEGTEGVLPVLLHLSNVLLRGID